MGENGEDFYSAVVDGSKEVLMESKRLIQLVTQQTSEEDILEAARKTAKCTFDLLDFVDSSIEDKAHESTELQHLLASTKEMRSAVLELIKAARSLHSNPFDFLSKQTLDNCLGEVVKAIKGVIQASESMKEDREDNGEEEEFEFDVVEDTRATNKALQQLFTAAKEAVSTEAFVQHAKVFLDAMNQLVLASKSLNLGLDDKLKEEGLTIINSAKLLAKEPGNQLHHKRFQDAMRQCQATMKTFLFACSKYKEGGSKAAISAISQIPPNTPDFLKPDDRRNSAKYTNTDDKRNSGKYTTTTDDRRNSGKYTVTDDRRNSGKYTNGEPPPLNLSAPPLAEVKSTGPTLKDLRQIPRPFSSHSKTASPRALPSHHALKKSPGIRNITTDVAPPATKSDANYPKVIIDLTTILREALPQFRQEWDTLLPQKKDYIVSKMNQIIQKHTPPPVPPLPAESSSEQKSESIRHNLVPTPINKALSSQQINNNNSTNSSSSGDEDDEDDAAAMMELQKIIKMKSSADWGMMSLSSLKNLSRRFSRKSGVGDVDALTGITMQEIPKKMKEMSACVSEATVDLLDNVNETLAAMHATTQNSSVQKRKSLLAPKDAEKYLGHAVEQMFSIIRMTLGLTAKYRTEAEDDRGAGSVRKSTLPRPPQSPDEERQRAQKNLVNRILMNAVNITQNASRKGKLIDKIVSALNSSSYSNTNYVKLKLEESLDTKIYSESTGVRALAAQLLSAINALLEEQLSDIHNYGNVLQIEASGRSLVLTVGRLLDALETLKYISAVTTESSDTKTAIIPTQLEEDEKDQNLWEDEGESITSDNGAFKAGTLNAIVSRLTSDTAYDTKFLSTFITTYQSFTTPWKLLEKLLQRYRVPKGRVDEKRVPSIQLRVCVVLKYWIDNQCADFDASLIQALSQFLTTQLPKDGHNELSKQLSNLLAAKVEELSVKRKAHTVNPFSSLQVQERHSPAALFSALNESEIARQLTLIEFTLFSQIQSSELFNQSWNKPKQHHRAPHVLNMISRSNHLSFWVASLLLWAPSLKERANVLGKFIKIAQHLRDLNNYNTLMGVIAGINMSPISRLRNTFNELDKATLKILENLQILLNPSSSFKNYRQELHNANPPCLPYLGTYLTDLTFMEDGNPDTLPSKTGKQPLINFAKRELVYNVIRELQLYQQNSYKFPVVEPIHTFLTALPFGEDKDLYELSLQREPRVPEPASHK